MSRTYPNKKKNVQVSDLPHNSDAEQAVLGSAMLSKDALISVLSTLEESDFYEGKHQLIYRAMRNASERKVAVDVLTLTEELMNMKELENIGGVNYLKACCDSMVALSALDFYIHIVNDQSCLRRLLVTIRDIDDKYHTEEIENIDQFIQDSEANIKDATEKRRVSQFRTTNEVAKAVELEIILVGPEIVHLRHRGQVAHIVVEGASGGVGGRFRVLQDSKRIVGPVAVVVEQEDVRRDSLLVELRAQVVPDEDYLVFGAPGHRRGNT